MRRRRQGRQSKQLDEDDDQPADGDLSDQHLVDRARELGLAPPFQGGEAGFRRHLLLSCRFANRVHDGAGARINADPRDARPPA